MSTSIVVGLDGSAASGRAADCAAAEAARDHLRLVLACVVDWSPYSLTTPEENERRAVDKKREIQAAQERVLDPVLERLGGTDLEMEGLVRHGHPAETLVTLAKEYDAGRIVVGKIGQSRVRTLLFGSTPSHLIQLSPVPVLVVP